ncbi:MAG: shikimate dehydrogenase [Clostridia bacterium]|nr:shikimate dehydrogenase [Clostridia bacterium]
MSKKYRVIGYPIGHSMSPFIHKELFSLKGFSADYEKQEIAPDMLREEFESTLKNLDGFNVTIPHKVSIIKYLDRLDGSAAEYGAVNVVANENGEYVGYNTDAYGFLEGLKFSKIALSGKVLVYGFGGAARTIITECIKAGCEVTIGTAPDFLEQGTKTVQELSEKLGADIKIILGEDIKEKYTLLVNATPVGMYPKVNAMPLKAEQIDLFDAVYDIVYNPEETLLLKTAKEKGKICGGGLSMLVTQAAKAHEYFYGAEFSNEEIEATIKNTAKAQEEFFKGE